MSRRSETEAAFRKIAVSFDDEDDFMGAASVAMDILSATAQMELARSLAEAADEMKEIKRLLEKLNRR